MVSTEQASLDPTPSRIALLQDVLSDHVYRVEQRSATYDMNGFTGRRVTRQLKELVAAGWVELGPPHPLLRTPYWRLTAAGQYVLAEATL